VYGVRVYAVCVRYGSRNRSLLSDVALYCYRTAHKSICDDLSQQVSYKYKFPKFWSPFQGGGGLSLPGLRPWGLSPSREPSPAREPTRRRITVTSSLNQISTDQVGKRVVVRWEALLRPPSPLPTAGSWTDTVFKTT